MICFHCSLENVSDEVVAPMVPTWLGIIVVPSLVVDRDPHLWWIAVVHVVGTTIVFVTPVVLGVRYVRVVIKTVQVLRRLTGAPTGSITFFLCLTGLVGDQRQRDSANGDNANLTNHQDSSVVTARPPELGRDIERLLLRSQSYSDNLFGWPAYPQ